MIVGSQMPELDQGTFCPPLYKIGSQNTPDKLGLKIHEEIQQKIKRKKTQKKETEANILWYRVFLHLRMCLLKINLNHPHPV